MQIQAKRRIAEKLCLGILFLSAVFHLLLEMLPDNFFRFCFQNKNSIAFRFVAGAAVVHLNVATQRRGLHITEAITAAHSMCCSFLCTLWSISFAPLCKVDEDRRRERERDREKHDVPYIVSIWWHLIRNIFEYLSKKFVFTRKLRLLKEHSIIRHFLPATTTKQKTQLNLKMSVAIPFFFLLGRWISSIYNNRCDSKLPKNKSDPCFVAIIGFMVWYLPNSHGNRTLLKDSLHTRKFESSHDYKCDWLMLDSAFSRACPRMCATQSLICYLSATNHANRTNHAQSMKFIVWTNFN